MLYNEYDHQKESVHPACASSSAYNPFQNSAVLDGFCTHRKEEIPIEKDIAILGLKATREILELLDTRGTAQHSELTTIATPPTVNRLLRDLMNLDLVHCFRDIRDGVEKEWFEPTEKGKKVVQCLRELEELMKE